MHDLLTPLLVPNFADGDYQTLGSTIEACKVVRVELKQQSKKQVTALADIGIEVRA